MKTLRLLYYKWIKRCCPHFCFICTHKSWCIKEIGKENLTEELKEWFHK